MAIVLENPIPTSAIKNSTYEDQRVLMAFLLGLLALMALVLFYLEFGAPMIRGNLSEHANPVNYPRQVSVTV